MRQRLMEAKQTLISLAHSFISLAQRRIEREELRTELRKTLRGGWSLYFLVGGK
jgi:hypothetical protein